MREWIRWKRVWEMHHTIAPNFFATEERKILMAAVKLKDSIADSWQREVESPATRQHTWDTFTEFLKERIASKSVRIEKAQKALRTAKIGKTQSAQDYLTYIESLEADYPPTNEEQRVANYKLGLDDDLLGLIALSTPEQELQTREGWVKHTTRVRNIQATNTIIIKPLQRDQKQHDSNHSGSKQAPRQRSDDENNEHAQKFRKKSYRGGRGGWRGGSRNHGSQSHQNAPSNTQQGASATPAQPTETKRPEGPRCYLCHKVGHLKPQCPERQNKISQIEELEDSDTESKNGRASR